MNSIELRKAIKAKRPVFRRQEINKKKRLEDVWRRPSGMHSKTRHRRQGYSPWISVGWGSPAEARGLHKSGLKEAMVSCEADIAVIDPKKEGAVISGTVGMKKKISLVEKLLAKKITIINMKKPEEYSARVKQELEKRKKAAKKTVEHTPEKKAAPKPEKKEEKAEPEKTEQEKKDAERKEAEKILTRKAQ